ncbi:MAG: nitrite/sulfite reductase [Acidobacteria bacterium]|nr:nitrite/sulfite reductase [Acidobacteriota bacterium]
MAAVDDPRTLGRTRLSFANEAEIDEFVATLERFERGEISPDEWRVYRLVRGTYGQRQPDVQMLRVKIPQGILTAPQLHALADVAERWSRGFAHITTRQNFQFHFMRPEHLEPSMRRLAEAGLTTREACGNSVRNITACPYAGVAHDEVFDVTPYAEALTRYLLRHPLSSSLPRKFKIAFEGCSHDHAVTAINDIGWRARIRRIGETTVRGFLVTVGGGTSIFPRSGQVLYDFLPAGEILDVAEAIVQVFHRLGDRVHKQRNRMKFLIKDLGWERWREEYGRALEQIRANGGASLPFDPDDPPVEEPPDWWRPRPPSPTDVAAFVATSTLRGPGIMPSIKPHDATDGSLFTWRQTNVRAQKQAGYSTVTATVPLGDLAGTQIRALAELASTFGDGSGRVTPEQDLLFRWVPSLQVRDLYLRLASAGLGAPHAGTIADVTSCPGAESCRIAVTQSRGLGRVLESHLRDHPDLIALAPDLTIKISGCPNGCGHHHIAGIGFQGSVRKVGGRAVPQYFVTVGGGVNGNAAFGQLVAKIPARRSIQALERLLTLYQTSHAAGETASAFFTRVNLETVKAALADLATITPDDAVPDDFVDLGETAEYQPEVLDGECSA